MNHICKWVYSSNTYVGMRTTYLYFQCCSKSKFGDPFEGRKHAGLIQVKFKGDECWLNLELIVDPLC